MKKVFITLLGTLIIAGADTSWRKTLTKAPAGPYKAKKYCKLNYVLSWDGKINSGNYTIEFDRNRGRSETVKVKSYGRSSGLVRSIFPYDFKAESRYRGNTLKPVSYKIWEDTREETKDLRGSFSGSKVTIKESAKPKDGGKPHSTTESFQHDQLFDLFTSVMYVGSQPLKNGDQINMVLLPFNKPYLAKVKVLGREKHLGHNCIKLDLKLSKVNSDLSLKHYDKMKSATMWISDDDNRVMVELRSKIFIGDVRATLKSSEW